MQGQIKSWIIIKENGFALVFLAVVVECAIIIEHVKHLHFKFGEVVLSALPAMRLIIE